MQFNVIKNLIFIDKELIMAEIVRKKVADLIIDEIKSMITKGIFKKGDKLPNQIDFAAQLGVSRPSLREAMHILTLIGAVEQKPGAGTIIKSTDLALWEKQLYPPLVSDFQATLELVEARNLIEQGVTDLAVKNATKEEIDTMARFLEEMTLALKGNRTKEYSKLDMEFHHCIAKASHNRFMIHMFLTIRGLMSQFIRETFIILPGLLDRSLKFHIQIFNGIKERNEKKAVDNMRKHIKDINDSLKKHYNIENK